jgi:predicted NBD/HSP70 family sugar kinase
MAETKMKVTIKNRPYFDPEFLPIAAVKRAYEKSADIPLCIAAEREDGLSATELRLRGTSLEDCSFTERMAKTLLWQKGGYKLYICGPEEVYKHIASDYAEGGRRVFDAEFMSGVYGRPFEVVRRRYEDKPEPRENPQLVGKQLDGCRIGFDAGGSDRKVSAVIDGKAVFTEETVWYPKQNPDPSYHYKGILSALKKAAARLPRVDGIGISSAGIFINNRTAVASLFRAVPKDAFERYVRDIYLRAAREIGDVPVTVCNDGDVTALAGSTYFGRDALLGIAMGTSEAAGYVDAEGNITGWLNELAFVPVDMNPNAARDEWSGDIGCGVSYFSQDAVIKLAEYARLKLPEGSPAEKLKAVQSAAIGYGETALRIFSDIGCYLGHTLPFYHSLYGMKSVLLLGRVMSDAGGETIMMTAKRVLHEEYPDIKIELILPDDKFRRMGQSMTAASLPLLREELKEEKI